MEKLIFRKFYKDVLSFFFTSLLIMSLIVWIIQAVNYLDFVIEDGHGIKVYFWFTILNFPKILNKILPFIFFISLFYIILLYEKKNELNIFWFNGINKLNFARKIIYFSLSIFLFQLILASYISPKSQFEGRTVLKNSNIDLFTSLIKKGRFINIAKNLTIFINEKNDDSFFMDIFIDETKNNTSRMIYARKGELINDGKIKIFKLQDGKIINYGNFKTNTFKFDQIDFNLSNLDTQTVIVPKIQEINTTTLLNCFLKVKNKKFESFNCDRKQEIIQELVKRLYKPIYIPLISLLCCLLTIVLRNQFNVKRNIYIIFILIFFILIMSEMLLKEISYLNYSLYIYITIPWIIFFISYFYLKIKSNYV